MAEGVDDPGLAEARRANLAQMRRALDEHNSNTCPIPAKAFAMNPADHGRFGLDSVWGLPVLADERQRPRFFRLLCDGSAAFVEQELEQEQVKQLIRAAEGEEAAPVERNAA